MKLEDYCNSSASDPRGEFEDAPVFCWCAECEEPIRVGEQYYKTGDGTTYCESCMGSFKKEAI